MIDLDEGASIYVLLDPITKCVRYVGKTHRARTRLAGHMSDARAGSHLLVHQWIRKLKLPPLMEVIAGTDDPQEACHIEQYWINYFRRTGHVLLNHNCVKSTHFLGKITRCLNAQD